MLDLEYLEAAKRRAMQPSRRHRLVYVGRHVFLGKTILDQAVKMAFQQVLELVQSLEDGKTGPEGTVGIAKPVIQVLGETVPFRRTELPLPAIAYIDDGQRGLAVNKEVGASLTFMRGPGALKLECRSGIVGAAIGTTEVGRQTGPQP